MNRKTLLGVAALALASAAGIAWGQCTTYLVNSGTGTIEPTTYVGGTCDDCVTFVAIPFTVNVYGLGYTGVNVSSNGNAQFVTADQEYFNDCTPAVTFTGPTLLPYWDDMWHADPGYGIHTALSGAPGSQTFTIEWRGEYYDNIVFTNFAVRLYENSSRIDFIYGSVPETGGQGTIGILDGFGNEQILGCDVAGTVSDGMMISFECPSSNNPFGVGAATPGSVYQTRPVLLTVAATGAVTPPSTGMTVTADLSALGGPSSQAFFDNGTNGDVTPGDNVFSFLTSVPASTPPGAAAVPFVVADAQARSGNGSIGFTVIAAPPSDQYHEVFHGGGDTGELMNDAQVVNLSGPVNTIAGTLNGAESDLYRIHMCSPGSFSATTVGGTTVDTQLFLVDANGMGVAMNDDTPAGGVLQSSLSSTFTASLPAGDFYLGVSQWDRDMVDAGFQELWLDTVGGVYTVEHAPDGPGAASPFVMWTSSAGVGGAYVVTISGVSGGSCGPTCGTADFDGDGDFGTDFDIEAFFSCLAGNCCATCHAGGSDFDGDGDSGTDADIEAFFRVLAGGNC